MDISGAREPAVTDLASFISGDQGVAEPATAVSASLAGDSISTSPLTFFGGVVEQIGRSMMNDASMASQTSGASHQGDGFDHAIGLLEGVIGLMSAYGDDPGALSPEIARLGATGELPSGSE